MAVIEKAPPLTRARRLQRSDIQALRAIAVLLVILDHLVLLQKLPGGPAGGFIGVDVFFVISGFLITQHLVTEIQKDGRVSFKNFYVARARRILPMALLVILVTIAASALVFWPWQVGGSALDGLWAALFLSNIAFAFRGVDYFSADHHSIFQHYWSLSVEEQFYIMWPVLITATAIAAFKRFPAARSLLAVTATVAILSFAWAMMETEASPTFAYFSTFSRAFEFALGGMLAILAPRAASIPMRIRPWLSAAGILIIVISVWIIDPTSGFPGPMALTPVTGAVLYIAAGTGSDRPVQMWPLRTRLATAIGDASYSLYLWHWPVIMIIAALIPREIVVIPVALALTVVLSWASYRWVEEPVRNSAWLKRSQRPRAFTNGRVTRNVGLMTAALLIVGVGTAALDFAVRKQVGVGESHGVAAGSQAPQADQPAEAAQLVAELQAMIEQGKRRNSWADLRPAISEIENYTGALATDCWTRAEDEPKTCLRGDADAPHTVVVFGDSIAMNAAFAVDTFVQQNPDWNIRVFAKLGCAAPNIPTSAPGGGTYESCDEFRDWAISEIRKIQPDAIWMTSALPRSLPGVDDAHIVDVWEEGLGTTLEALDGSGETFVVMPPPAGEDLAFCSRPYNTPVDCGSTITKRWLEVRDASAYVANAEGAKMVDTGMWFCDAGGNCPAVIGDFVVRRDERHLTYDFGAYLAPMVAGWVLAD
ncbi:acyltransferase family protein [Arthrobacter sp. NPDC089319]|uniref:acyltransferase family protein n=1 Tax=Arthrobacter sp. NPDC089319 TaxID=3155915 RepID=UPI003419F8C3